ncbi:MAG TPA: GyrI-like domain-containing protein [Chitinophagaceae bacterium]|nr:GyrI-like domain-containing protein [Chitinophagaceae bacterium]
MKFLKGLLYFIIALLVLLLLVSFLLPSNKHVERVLQMNNVKPESVFAQVNNMKSYNNWMPWNQKDPQMKQVWGAKTEGVGASYSWESKVRDVGNGKITITESVPDKLVKTELDFLENGKATAAWEIKQKEGGTEVKWYLDSKVGGNFFAKTMQRYFFLFMDKMVGPDLEKGLENLQKQAEANPAMPSGMPEPKMEIEEKNTSTMNILYIKETAANISEIGAKLGAAYAEIGTFAKSIGIKATGMPMAFYSGSSYPMQLDAAVPVNKLPPATEGRINTKQLWESRAVVVHFWGPYELIPKAYAKIAEWMKANNKESNGAPYEVYVGDPLVIKDPYQVQTDIYQPIK